MKARCLQDRPRPCREARRFEFSAEEEDKFFYYSNHSEKRMAMASLFVYGSALNRESFVF